jgi:hypothetical protein
MFQNFAAVTNMELSIEITPHHENEDAYVSIFGCCVTSPCAPEGSPHGFQA